MCFVFECVFVHQNISGTKAVSDTTPSCYTHSALEMCSENVISSYITHTEWLECSINLEAQGLCVCVFFVACVCDMFWLKLVLLCSTLSLHSVFISSLSLMCWSLLSCSYIGVKVIWGRQNHYIHWRLPNLSPSISFSTSLKPSSSSFSHFTCHWDSPARLPLNCLSFMSYFLRPLVFFSPFSPFVKTYHGKPMIILCFSFLVFF